MTKLDSFAPQQGTGPAVQVASAPGAASNGRNEPRPFKRPFGGTGWKVSALTLGTLQFGGEWGAQDDRDSVRVVHAALDGGINFIDTGDSYGQGRSEAVVGQALAGRRDAAYIATKFGPDSPIAAAELSLRSDWGALARRALEASLQRLGTDYVDLYQVHNVTEAALLSDELFAEFALLQQEGKVRAIGVTLGPGEGHAAECIRAAELRPIASVQATYNLLSQNPARVAFPFCRARGVAVMAREPFAQGALVGQTTQAPVLGGSQSRRWSADDAAVRLNQVRAFDFLARSASSSRAEAALRFVLANSDATTVVCGMRSAEEVASNLEIAGLPPLDVHDLQRVSEVYDDFPLHPKRG